jgi:hypothetical protein
MAVNVGQNAPRGDRDFTGFEQFDRFRIGFVDCVDIVFEFRDLGEARINILFATLVEQRCKHEEIAAVERERHADFPLKPRIPKILPGLDFERHEILAVKNAARREPDRRTRRCLQRIRHVLHVREFCLIQVLEQPGLGRRFDGACDRSPDIDLWVGFLCGELVQAVTRARLDDEFNLDAGFLLEFFRDGAENIQPQTAPGHHLDLFGDFLCHRSGWHHPQRGEQCCTRDCSDYSHDDFLSSHS